MNRYVYASNKFKKPKRKPTPRKKTNYNRALTHPDREDIDRMFREGHSAGQISDWLRHQHRSERLYLSIYQLREYRKKYLATIDLFHQGNIGEHSRNQYGE